MTEPAVPPHEAERSPAPSQHAILDMASDKPLDDLVYLAAYICETPIALISLIDSDRRWVTSKVNLTERQTAQIIAF